MHYTDTNAHQALSLSCAHVGKHFATPAPVRGGMVQVRPRGIWRTLCTLFAAAVAVFVFVIL